MKFKHYTLAAAKECPELRGQIFQIGASEFSRAQDS
jgi:hypothetical protein